VEKTVDARGLACPQPVICTKKALEEFEGEELVTIVDNEVARDNVLRYVKSQNLSAEVEEKADEYYIRIHKPEYAGLEPQLTREKDYIIFMGNQYLGHGDDELGQVLTKSFFYTLTESDSLPAQIILINSAVKLACENSQVLQHLMDLDKRGVQILACGTCLDYYGIKEKLCVGSVSNMYTILEQVTLYPRVVTLP
jgi:selenium metabolism protein YedF